MVIPVELSYISPGELIMWNSGWREEAWSSFDQDWEVIVIGGGITGAGVFLKSVLMGYKTILLEANDFSFGTSSRSSKLVHGGFRYLRNKQYRVTYEAVKEREWLIKESQNTVMPLEFILPSFWDSRTPGWEFGLGVGIYDLMASKWAHKSLTSAEICDLIPFIKMEGLNGGHSYFDANLDDSRLVLRIVRQAVRAGGLAINYCKVTQLIREGTGKVAGAIVADQSDANLPEKEIRAKVVINATGPWSDDIREKIQKPNKLRKLRGSHLVFPYQKFPVKQAVTLFHPDDNRAMFAIPWEGTTIIGTTDLDYPFLMDVEEPFATMGEVAYILRAMNFVFPGLALNQSDIISSFSGIRPIISTGKANPSQESRAHQVWVEDGLITITGGKLTTFRIMANQTMKAARQYLPYHPDIDLKGRLFERFDQNLKDQMDEIKNYLNSQYLYGRLGVEIKQFLTDFNPMQLATIFGAPNTWEELKYSARYEGVVHLDDLLLRRVRIGLLIADGGKSLLPEVKQKVKDELSWSEGKWVQEQERYLKLWNKYYSPFPVQ